MTTYNAKDLIEQAQMLADLQNSDFISWKENIMFMDNAWTDLYQQIINHGDKTFLKSFEFEGTEIELPYDFYQLQYVCYYDGLYERPINRKAKTSNREGPYYDIVGNSLIIKSNINTLRKIRVDYYPVKQSITYAAKDYEVDNDFWRSTFTFVDCSDKNILYKNGGNYYVYDILNGSVKDNGTGTPFMLAGTAAIKDATKPYFKANNKAFYTSYASKTLTIYKANGNVLKTITDVNTNLSFPTQKINAMTKDGLYYVVNGVLKFFNFETKQITDYATDVVSNNVYAFNDNIYYEMNDGIYRNECKIWDAKEYDTFRGVMKEDLNTGYGILTDTFVIKSAYNDSVLDFPSNFYFTYLGYKLAVYYKVKQGADPSLTSAMANDAMVTFYNSLPRDGNEFIRISNAYAK